MDTYHSQRDLIMANDVKVEPSAQIWFCKNLLPVMESWVTNLIKN